MKIFNLKGDFLFPKSYIISVYQDDYESVTKKYASAHTFKLIIREGINGLIPLYGGLFEEVKNQVKKRVDKQIKIKDTWFFNQFLVDDDFEIVNGSYQSSLDIKYNFEVADGSEVDDFAQYLNILEGFSLDYKKKLYATLAKDFSTQFNKEEFIYSPDFVKNLHLEDKQILFKKMGLLQNLDIKRNL